MDCPRCSEPDVAGPECPRCGVVLAKARPRRPAPGARPAPASDPPRGRPGPGSVVLLLVAAAAAVWAVRRPPPPPAPSASPGAPLGASPAPDTAPRGARALPLPLPPRVVPAAPSPSAAPELPREGGAADRDEAARLASLLATGAPVDERALHSAAELHARYGAHARGLLEAVLLQAGEQARAVRRYREAQDLIERAAGLAPDSPRPRRALSRLLLETGDWEGAEAAARAALGLDRGDPEAAQGLAYALLRQDRTRASVEVLEEFLEDHEHADVRALLARIASDVDPEASLTEQKLAHFHVRYDGEEHVAVGREVLRVLDRHYATLVRTFDHRPQAPIPVILLSRESYAAATGAPGWSGGLYDSFDGRVRIPIAGLTPALTPEIDSTLLHELTHAFVADRSRGVAPREIQEGLAQLMEGKRVEDLLDEEQMAALAQGRLRGVGGYYMAALSFVQHLHGQRGQGGINDLLLSLAETGNLDEALERVYGRDGAGLRREWETRLRQQYGR